MAASAQQPIDLHYWPTPNGRKITITLEEIGLPYQVQPVNIGKGDQFKPDFLRISPNNRMPAIVDPAPAGRGSRSPSSSPGRSCTTSAEKTGQLYPADERGRFEVRQWVFWQVGGLGPMLGQNHHFRLYAPEKIPYAIDRYANETARLYGVLDTRLADRPYVAGDYSIADIAIVALGQAVGATGAEHRRLPAREAMARCGAESPCRKERHRDRTRKIAAPTTSRTRRAGDPLRPEGAVAARAEGRRAAPQRTRSRSACGRPGRRGCSRTASMALTVDGRSTSICLAVPEIVELAFEAVGRRADVPDHLQPDEARPRLAGSGLFTSFVSPVTRDDPAAMRRLPHLATAHPGPAGFADIDAAEIGGFAPLRHPRTTRSRAAPHREPPCPASSGL